MIPPLIKANWSRHHVPNLFFLIRLSAEESPVVRCEKCNKLWHFFASQASSPMGIGAEEEEDEPEPPEPFEYVDED